MEEKIIYDYIYNLISKEVYPSKILNIVVTEGFKDAFTGEMMQKNSRHVRYITITDNGEKIPPSFLSGSKNIDIDLSIIRDSKIELLLNSKNDDIEYLIWSEDELKKIELLRRRGFKSVETFKKEYSDEFSIGDKIWYQQQPGIITFQHEDKEPKLPTRWTVVVNGKEYRYVFGTEIIKRVVENLDNLTIPKKVEDKLIKLPTEKLLKMYRKSMKINKGKGNLAIKKILNQRENI